MNHHLHTTLAHARIAKPPPLSARRPRQRRAAGYAVEVLDDEIVRRPLLPGVSTPWLEDRRRELVDRPTDAARDVERRRIHARQRLLVRMSLLLGAGRDTPTERRRAA